MGVNDFLLAPIYIAIIYAIAFSIKRKMKDEELKKYFIPGLSVKIFGAIATGFIYWYYYGAGDSIYYYWRILKFKKLFARNFQDGLEAFINFPSFAESFEKYHIYQGLKAYDMSSFLTVKLAFIVNLVCFDTYILIAILFSVICYSGLWRLFKMVKSIFPDTNTKYLAYVCLFIPSVFFWGSGLFKDTVTLGCLCWGIVSLYKIFFKREKVLYNLIIVLVTMTLIGYIKGYLIMALAPAFMFWLFLHYRKIIGQKSTLLGVIATPLLVVIAAGLGAVMLNQLGGVFEKYAVQNVEKKAQDMQRWHTYRVEVLKGGDGSSYTLGHVEFTTVGILKKIPAAINVTLFRPYLWEVGNPVMLMAAVEALILFLLTLKIFLLSPGNVFRLFKHPFLGFCLVFSLIIAFSAGFTSYNFGALVRYKIPCLPFYGIILAVMMPKPKDKKVKESEVLTLDEAKIDEETLGLSS